MFNIVCHSFDHVNMIYSNFRFLVSFQCSSALSLYAPLEPDSPFVTLTKGEGSTCGCSTEDDNIANDKEIRYA